METEKYTPPEANIELAESLDHTRTLFELSAKDTGLCKERIEKASGLVRLHVHPFYTYDFGDAYAHIPEEEKNNRHTPALILARTISTEPEKTPLNFVMEVHTKIKETKAQCDEWAKESKNYPIIVPTLDRRATPALPNVRHGAHHNRNWQKLAARLTELGVKNILLSGNYLALSKEPHRGKASFKLVDTNPRSESVLYANDECVMSAYSRLLPHFGVEFSNATYPHNIYKRH